MNMNARAEHAQFAPLRRPTRLLALLLAGLTLTACEATRNATSSLFGTSTPSGTPGFVRGFLGGVAIEEPVAAAIARDVLSAGGNAADAAVAAAFALTVTLPSRVGLGGGGACLLYDARRNDPEALVFLPGPRGGIPPHADRPAAVPLMARGLFAVQARMPRGRPFEELISPAEQLARFGTPMSRALHADLIAVQTPLFADPQVRAVFAGPDGRAIQVGDRFQNPALGGTLTALRVSGVGDMHLGGLARRLEEASGQIGAGTITVAELRAALPQVIRPIFVDGRAGDRIAFLPPPADGGLAAAAAFQALQSGQTLEQAQARAMAVASASRLRGGDPQALLTATDLAGGMPGNLPASAGLMVYDRDGNAVTCAFTMNNLFGTGRIAPGMGFLMAAAPGVGRVEPPLLSAAIGWSPNLRAFRMAVAGSGQESAAMAVAGPVAAQMLRDANAEAAVQIVPEPGRSQIGMCPRYLPGWPSLCTTLSDPRGAGVALGATDR
ncbi:gamma-glutamyltransferase [Sediminicoccus sp. KRV36]|uniref:gamma-glutamyltransferase n=1 Tax=Sediminicoccus sp. KRV36 TaxID=3133721 RepID=UPI00200DD54E|nr:gamma-glutamyltransferase [Sediminicoccus rosea]UPY36814.1 gamma-glutamyltransferase [Sediminicoccus rosea]